MRDGRGLDKSGATVRTPVCVWVARAWMWVASGSPSVMFCSTHAALHSIEGMPLGFAPCRRSAETAASTAARPKRGRLPAACRVHQGCATGTPRVRHGWVDARVRFVSAGCVRNGSSATEPQVRSCWGAECWPRGAFISVSAAGAATGQGKAT